MRVEAETAIAAPRREVWELITDPQRIGPLWEGATEWEVVPGEPAIGPRARYNVLMRVGSADVGGVLEVVEWDEPGDMSWVSITGPTQRGRWRLRELGPDRTSVSLRLAYQAPGGLLGLIADRAASFTLRPQLRRTLANVKRALEAGG